MEQHVTRSTSPLGSTHSTIGVNFNSHLCCNFCPRVLDVLDKGHPEMLTTGGTKERVIIFIVLGEVWQACG